MAANTATVATAPCRPQSKLLLIPDVLKSVTVFLGEDGTFLVEAPLNERHILTPGFISPLCPGNADGVVVVADKSKNVANPVALVENNVIKVTFKLRDPNLKNFLIFLRIKYQEDKATTGKDKPRKKAIEVFPLSIPAKGKRTKANANEIPEE